MITELYEALKEAGASDEKAKAAAGAIANYENHFIRIESKLDSLETKIGSFKIEFESELKILKTELSIIKWLVGLGIAGIISMIIKLFT